EQLGQGGSGTGMKAPSGFGQSNAPCRTNEQRHADARLQYANGLAHRRGRHAELVRGFAEASVPRDAEECLDPVERTLPDCEALLHTPTTLSPIVARDKRPYIRLADQDQRRSP